MSCEELALRKIKTDDVKLIHIMRRCRSSFRGAFGINELKDIKITEYLFSIISSESDLGTRGTSWELIYLDVYGKDIRIFIDKHTDCGNSGKIKMNRKQIQSFRSDVGGQYCIYFLSKCIE